MYEQLADVTRTLWPAVPDTPPTTMHAVVFRRFGGPEVLEVDEIPVPSVGAGPRSPRRRHRHRVARRVGLPHGEFLARATTTSCRSAPCATAS
jgi:hypothetical protein